MNLADKTIINIFAKSGEAVLLLVSSVVLVRYLGKREYGTFLQLMLIMNTAVMLTFLGLPQSIYYFFHKTKNKAFFVVRNVFIFLTIGSVAGGSVFFLMSHLAHWLNNPLLREYRVIIALLVFLRGSIMMRDPLLISHGSLLLNSVAAITSNVLFFVPVMICAVLSMGLSFLLQVLLLASVLDFFCFVALMGWLVGQVKKTDGQHKADCCQVSLLEQLCYAFPIGLSSYVGLIGRQIDQYIVSIFFTPLHFAVYSRGALRVPVLSSIQFTVNNIMMPYYVTDYREGKIKDLLSRFHLCVEKIAKINFPVFVFLFLTAPSLISLLYTDQYLGAVPVFRAYLFLLVINITTYGIIPRATGQTKSIFYASLINVIANVILSCLLVPVYGVTGAAIATILCAFGSAYYYLFISCRILDVEIQKIFPWKFLTKYLSLSLLAGIPLIGTYYFFMLFETHLLVSLVCEGIVYWFGAIFLITRSGLLTPEDFDTLSKWLKCDVERLFNRVSFL